MSTKSVCIVVADVVGNVLVNAIRGPLEEAGYTVNVFAGNGAPITNEFAEIDAAIATSSCVITGLASTSKSADAEMRAVEYAHRRNVPALIFNDMPYCVLRPWLTRIAGKVSGILGVISDDVRVEVAVRFPNAIPYNTGNPSRDWATYNDPGLAEKGKTTGALLGLKDGERLILYAGRKTALEFPVIALLQAALYCRRVDLGYCDTRLILAPHPGSPVFRAVDPKTGEALALYEQIAKFSPVPTSTTTSCGLGTNDLILAADLVTGFMGDALVCAACLRKPIIHLATRALLEEYGDEVGVRTVETVHNRVGLVQETLDEWMLCDLISSVLDDPEEITKMRRRQEEAYPLSETPSPARDAIVRIIREIVEGNI